MRYLIRDIKDLNFIIANVSAGHLVCDSDELIKPLYRLKDRLQDQLFNAQVDGRYHVTTDGMVRTVIANGGVLGKEKSCD